MYNYLLSFFYKQEKDIEIDEKTRRQKYLVCQQIKSSKIRLKTNNPIPHWTNKKKDFYKCKCNTVIKPPPFLL
jgi:hypothetical protein